MCGACEQQYWPVDGGSVVAGKFTVTKTGPEERSDNVVVTNLSVSYEGRLTVGVVLCSLLCLTETTKVFQVAQARWLTGRASD